jgi:hypothetical protein
MSGVPVRRVPPEDLDFIQGGQVMLFQLIEWAGMALVLLGLWAFGSNHMRLGFIAQLVSAVAWTVVSINASLWGLLALQGGIAYLAMRGLWKHRI